MNIKGHNEENHNATKLTTVVLSSSLALEMQKQEDIWEKWFSTKKIILLFFQQKEIKYLENVKKKKQLQCSDVNHSKHITKI